MYTYNKIRLLIVTTVAFAAIVFFALACNLYSVRNLQTMQVIQHTGLSRLQDFSLYTVQAALEQDSRSTVFSEWNRNLRALISFFQNEEELTDMSLLERISATDQLDNQTTGEVLEVLQEAQGLIRQKIDGLAAQAKTAGIWAFILSLFLCAGGAGSFALGRRIVARDARIFTAFAENPEEIPENDSRIAQVHKRLHACRDLILHRLESARKPVRELVDDYFMQMLDSDGGTVDESVIQPSEILVDIHEVREQIHELIEHAAKLGQVAAGLDAEMGEQAESLRSSIDKHEKMQTAISHATEHSSAVNNRLSEVGILLQSGNDAVVNMVDEMRSIERDIRGILDAIPIINTIA